MEDQAVEVVGDVGEREFRLGACQADGADEKAEPVLLMSKDMLDCSADGGLLRVGPCHVPSQFKNLFGLGGHSIDFALYHPVGNRCGAI